MTVRHIVINVMSMYPCNRTDDPPMMKAACKHSIASILVTITTIIITIITITIILLLLLY